MTRGEYEKGYVQLRQTSPGHALMPVISQGYTPLACEYLRIALLGAPTVKPSNESLFIKQSSLYSKRAQLSNRLYDCTTDMERADISLQISDIQDQIREVKRSIEYFSRTGKLPEAKPGKNFVPGDGRSKEKKLRSVRSSISYVKKQIRAEKLKESPNEKTLKKYERKLNDLIGYARELS